MLQSYISCQLLSLFMELRSFFTSKKWWGKIIAAFFGFLMAGPIGGLLGLLIGNFFDRGLVEHFSKPFWFFCAEKNPNIRHVFFQSTFLLLGHLAKSEGRVSEASIDATRALMKRMELNEAEKKQAREQFTLGKQTQFDLNQTLYTLYTTIQHNPNLIRLFIETQYTFIRESGLTNHKLKIMNAILARFQLAPLYEQQRAKDDFVWDQYRSSHRSTSAQRPSDPLFDSYGILNVKPTATQAEVKKAYRRLISTHHPDRLIAKNATEAAIKKANEKTQQIRKAYEYICKIKGW